MRFQTPPFFVLIVAVLTIRSVITFSFVLKFFSIKYFCSLYCGFEIIENLLLLHTIIKTTILIKMIGARSITTSPFYRTIMIID